MKKREIILILAAIILFVVTSLLSFSSIWQLRGSARIVNYAGIVRGATQRLVKKEMQGYQDDSLIKRLDSILYELRTGEGNNDLDRMPDATFMDNLSQVNDCWKQVKEEIGNVRGGDDNTLLLELSEEHFTLADRMVSSAEYYTERQVRYSTTVLLVLNAIFVLLIITGLIMCWRALFFRKRAEALGRIAYTDSLTQLPNRAGCEMEMRRCTGAFPDKPIVVLILDMDSSAQKGVGDQRNDRMLVEFSRIALNAGKTFGFVGRYEGNDFLAIFPNAEESIKTIYLNEVREKLEEYNDMQKNREERIGFEFGYVIGNTRRMTVEEMTSEAIRKMNIQRRVNSK